MIISSILCPHCGLRHDTMSFYQAREGGEWFGYCPTTKRQIMLTFMAVPEADIRARKLPDTIVGPKETK